MTLPASEPEYHKAQLLEAIYRADVLRAGRLHVEYPGLHIHVDDSGLSVNLGSRKEPALGFNKYGKAIVLMKDVHLHCTFKLDRLEIALERMRRLMVLDDLAAI